MISRMIVESPLFESYQQAQEWVRRHGFYEPAAPPARAGSITLKDGSVVRAKNVTTAEEIDHLRRVLRWFRGGGW